MGHLGTLRLIQLVTVIIASLRSLIQLVQSEPEILKRFRCPERYLVQTHHRIRGGTDNQLDIKDVLFMHIRIGLKEATDGLRVKRHVVFTRQNLP